MDLLPSIIQPILELASSVLMDPQHLKGAMDNLKKGEPVRLRVILEQDPKPGEGKPAG